MITKRARNSIGGTRSAARRRKIGIFSDLWCSGLLSFATTGLSLVNEVGPEHLELVDEVLITATDDPDVADRRHAVGAQGRDQIAEPAAQVWHANVGPVKLRRPGDHGRLLKVALRHPPGV